MVKKVDSTHEEYFEWWLEEAKGKGLVRQWKRIEEPFVLTEGVKLPFTKILKTKSNLSEKHLLHPHVYTPDYVIQWNGVNSLHDDMWCLDSNSRAFFLSYNDVTRAGGNHPTTIVDIKPDRINRNQQYSYYTFPINQKLMWAVHNTYVQKVVLFPASNSKTNTTLFQRTWTPERYIREMVYKTDRKGKWKKGDSKIKFKYKTLKEWL